jgi:hypothetical protein
VHWLRTARENVMLTPMVLLVSLPAIAMLWWNGRVRRHPA